MPSTPRMQPHVTLSFRWIGPAACLLLGTLGCAVIHHVSSARAARAVRVAEPPPVESAPSALVARAAAGHRLELLAAAWTADYVPRVQGFLDHQYDVNDAFRDNDAFEAGVQAQVRLFDGLARERRRAEVRAQREALALRWRDVERRIAHEVECARLAVEEQQSALAVAERSVAQAESSLRVEDDLYRHDKSATTAVLDSELTLAASAALKAATGGGVP